MTDGYYTIKIQDDKSILKSWTLPERQNLVWQVEPVSRLNLRLDVIFHPPKPDPDEAPA